MAASPTIKVKGLRELQRAFKEMDVAMLRELDGALKGIAETVAKDAARRFSAIDLRSATGFKPKLRGFGKVSVVQTRRSKHLRPSFGSLQMRRALIPAAYSNEDNLERDLETLLDRLEHKHGF